MKKFLIILFLFLINTPFVFADSKEIVKTKVNLTCTTDDQTLTQSFSITEFELKSGKLYVGKVNGFLGKAYITETSYTINYEMDLAGEKIKVTHPIDITRATKIETWVFPSGKMKMLRGSCKTVKPKI